MKGIFAIMCILALAGCGADKKVTVGEPGAKGEYRKDIDTAKSVAGEATDRIRTGEKEVYGG